MVVVYPVSHRDYTGCLDLLSWVAQLGPYDKHKAVLVMSTKINQLQQEELLQKLKACGFGRMFGAKQKNEEESGWPLSCNRMFQLAAEFIESSLPEPWFWNEPDAIPLKEGWLDALDEEYRRGGKPYMGTIFNWINATSQRRHITGTAVYPPNIRRFNPATLRATSEPWDVTSPELTIRYAHQTDLIAHRWGDRVTNVPPTFPDFASVVAIPVNAVVFHRNKDGTLISRLREARQQVQPTIETPAVATVNHKPVHHVGVGIIASVRHKIASVLNGASTFLHAGNIGDVIYAMYAIKAFGGGDLIICPEQRKTAPCAVPINRAQFDVFAPLIREQKYIRNVSFEEKYPEKLVYDLNTFRNTWTNHIIKHKEGLDTLAKTHFFTLGIVDRFDNDQTWLQVPNPIETGKIVCHRSPRYNADNFPWKRLIREREKDLLFVGLESEWDRFQKEFGAKVSFWRVKDLLEMARVIAGARAFVGNQSSPLSIAVGVGQKIIAEELPRSPDTRFLRKNYTSQLLTEPDKLDFESL